METIPSLTGMFLWGGKGRKMFPPPVCHLAAKFPSVFPSNMGQRMGKKTRQGSLQQKVKVLRGMNNALLGEQ